MKQLSLKPRFGLAALCLLIAAPVAFGDGPIDTSLPVLIEAGPAISTTLYSDGSQVDLPTWNIWRPMCANPAGTLDQAALARIGAANRQAFGGGIPSTRVDGYGIGDNPAPRGGGLDVVFHVTGETPNGALEALQAAAAYIDSKFADPVTVDIDLTFDALGPGIIGATNFTITSPQSPQWPTARAALVADMDGDDVIQNWLPTGTTVPVRWNGGSATVSNVSSVYVTVGNLRAFYGSNTTHTGMTISNQFPFDFDPTDGINAGTICFQSTIVHEVGHALGFFCVLDFFPLGVSPMDLFRFQWTDGAGTNWNPDSYEAFQTTPRTISTSPDDDAITDLIVAEYRMSDGSPYTPSHFRHQSPRIGTMDPAIGYGETRWPDFYKESDLAVFDAIGWDYVAPVPFLPGDIDGDGDVDAIDVDLFTQVLLGMDTGDPAHVTRSDLNHDNAADGNDIQPFVAAILN